MALKKKMDLPNGTSCEYFRIYETNICWAERSAHITLAGYLNQEAREAGKRPMETKSFDYRGDEFPFSLNKLGEPDTNPISVAYEALKAVPEEASAERKWFKDAEDV
jgi:hypothetical protein